MKKILISIFAIIFSSIAVLASDTKFAQVDGAFVNASDEQSVKNFETLIDKINKENNLDFVVFTGNNISRPNKENLKMFLKKANKLKAPYYVVLGQKDVNKQKHFGKADYIKLVNRKNSAQRRFKKPNYVITKKDIAFIVADGSKEVIPTSNGYYRPEVIEWANKKITENENKNVIIIQHYPLIPPSNKESAYTFKADEYLKMLAAHKNVKAIVAGHFNVNKEEEINGITHIATQNAPTYRIIEIIDCDTNSPTIWTTIKE